MRSRLAKEDRPPQDTGLTAADGAAAGHAHEAGLPAASLIVPSRNRPEMLAHLVRSVLAGEAVPAEIIVVDQSADPHPTLPMMRSDRPCTVHYIWTREVGLSRARNRGIALAQFPLLAFSDDDMVASPTWWGELIRALVQAGTRSVVTGQVPPVDGGAGRFAPSTSLDERPAIYSGRLGVGRLFGGNMAMHREAVELLGGFDPRLGAGARFPAAEDNDFAYRLLEAGLQIVYVPGARLYHRAWRSERQYVPLRWSYGRGQGAYYAKHMALRDRYMLGCLARDLAQTLRRLAGRVRHHRQPRRAFGDAAYFLGVLLGAAEWLLTQRRHATR